MKAIIHNKAGDLSIEEISKPCPNDKQVLICVHAAGINRPDIFQRMGLYPPPPNASPILGLEVAGEIVEIGKNVTNFKIGDKVCALLNGGGYAQFAIAQEDVCFKIPNNISMIEAASIPETIMTVYENVFRTCGLKNGQSFLIHGGASGIGVMAIQMAKAIGSKIFTTIGSNEKAEFCKNLGADFVINYKEADFENIARENGGIDVILDMVGGPYIQKNINILNENGKLCYIAFLQGANSQINLMRLMLKRLSITGSTLRSRSDEDKAIIANGVKNDFWHFIENGTIKPIIDSVFEYKNIQAAHDLMQSNKHKGKIIITFE